MSINQLSTEKKVNDLKITWFAFLQASILLFAPSIGLWIVRIMRADEFRNESGNPILLFQNLAIGFTCATILMILITLIVYFIYLKYKKELDNAIDNSIAKLRNNEKQDVKPRININLNQAPAVPVTPQKSVVQINTKPVNSGPVKKVVTTTTTTTRPTGSPSITKSTGFAPRPGMSSMGARPATGLGPRPTGPAPRPGMSPMGARPATGLGPRPTGPAPRPGMSPMGARPSVTPIKK